VPILNSSLPELSLPSIFFTDPPPTEIYTLSLHDALPISARRPRPTFSRSAPSVRRPRRRRRARRRRPAARHPRPPGSCRCPACRSEEHTSELQSRGHLVCRLLLEKKKKKRAARESIPTTD